MFYHFSNRRETFPSCPFSLEEYYAKTYLSACISPIIRPLLQQILQFPLHLSFKKAGFKHDLHIVLFSLFPIQLIKGSRTAGLVHLQKE